MKDSKNAPQMPEMLFDVYMSGIKKFAPPLSTTKYLSSAIAALEGVNKQVGDIALYLTKDEFPKKFGSALLYMSKIGLNSALYILGSIDKNELLNSIDDAQDFIKTMEVSFGDVESKALDLLLGKLTESISNLISERESILKYENETKKKMDSGMSPDDIIKSEKDLICKFMEHLNESDTDSEDLDLKAGESKEEVIHDSKYGSIKRTTIRLPFALGEKVTDGNVIGKVHGYYPNQLRGGCDENSRVIIEVESSTAAFDKLDIFNIKEDVASSSAIDKNATYFETTVGKLKEYKMYS